MITGEIFISTTWAASTSFIPFDLGMRNVHNVYVNGIENRGQFATTAYVHGVWDYQVFEDGMQDYLTSDNSIYAGQEMPAAGFGTNRLGVVTNAFSPGTIIETSVRKLKASKSSPNRSGVQVSRRLVKGNKLVFRYVAHGELVRP